MTVVRPNLDLLVKLYKSALPDYDFMLRKLQTENKWLRFSPRLHELTKRFNCQNYPELYQGEARIQSALLRAIFESDEKIKHFLTDLNAKSLAEQYQFMNEFLLDVIDLGQWMDKHVPHLDALDWSPRTQAIAQRKWNKFTPEEQQQAVRFNQYSLSFSLASFYNYFSLMVHGRKLTQLVGEAMAGNKSSYCLAIQIDKSIIEHIPYFKDRYRQAQQTGEQDFLASVSKSLATPHFSGRIRRRLLYMLFALLEGTNWLDELKHREILDVCDQLGLDKYEARIESENALTKRLIEYREFQKFNQKSMP